MKVYGGERVLNREALVVVQNITGNGRSGQRPLEHISYHSPSGVEWGYAGRGPADLSLAILADYLEEPPALVLAALRSMWTPRSKAAALHQSFKERFVAREHRDEWQLHGDAIAAWFQTPDIQARLSELVGQDAELAEIRRLEAEAAGAEADAVADQGD